MASAGGRAPRLATRARLDALARCGVAAEPDPELEYLAGRVRADLAVPIGLVSVLAEDREVFPGLAGLPQPWASERSAPLDRSICRHVVSSGRPLVIADARADERLADAAADLGVAGYLGTPLLDSDGGVLGVLCAMDTAPRAWSDREVAALEQLAKACSGELRLRLADFDARQERARAERLQTRLRAASDRSELLLAASQTLTAARTVTDVRDQIADLFGRALDASHAELIISEDRGREGEAEDQRGSDPAGMAGTVENAGQWAGFDETGPGSGAEAVRERRLVHYADRQAIEAALGPGARALYEEAGEHAVVSAPVHGTVEIVGVLQVRWAEPHEADPAELAAIVTIAGYVAQALERVRFLQHRISVASELQAAMLTELPTVPGLRMAARYQPAAAFEQVGGDWYDCVTLPGEPGTVVISVGDVTGHDIRAATKMGQLRSMLRQACWHHRGGPPSEVITAVDLAGADFEVRASGTAVLAYLTPDVGGSRWAMRWTNAGHPPPILVRADGGGRLLEDHDGPVGWPDVFTMPRTDAEVTLEPGDTLLLYTDGLIERRDSDIDRAIATVRARAVELRAAPPAAIVDALLDDFAAEQSALAGDDDIAVFAIQIPGRTPA
jgi:serine phosphatase RsbU (regulator of sigma subunit)